MIKGSCSWLFKGKGDDVYLQEVWVCVWGEGGGGQLCAALHIKFICKTCLPGSTMHNN